MNATAIAVTAIIDFVCPGQIRELGIRDDLFDVAGSNLHTGAKIEWPGDVQQFAFADVLCDAKVSVAEKGELVREGTDQRRQSRLGGP